jgi:hypothetical protein
MPRETAGGCRETLNIAPAGRAMPHQFRIFRILLDGEVEAAISRFHPALLKKGRFAIVTNVGCGMRWTPERARRTRTGRTVKPRGTSAADFEVPTEGPRFPAGTSKSKRHWNLKFASALGLPKFAKVGPQGCAIFGRRALDISTLISSWRQCSRIAACDGDKKARSPGRAWNKPLKPLRGECRIVWLTCGDYARVLFIFRTRG